MKNINCSSRHLDRIIKPEQFRELTGLSRTTVHRMKLAGTLPTAVVINNRVLGFLESSYLKWLEENS